MVKYGRPSSVADVVDLHDVRVPQPPPGLGLPEEPLPLVRPGEGAGQEHLEGDGAVEPQVPRPVDDAHPAAAEHRLHLVAGDVRQLGGRQGREP